MADQRLPITGGCACGAIRYESTAPPMSGGFCHCSMCRRATGGLHAALLDFNGESFRYTKGTPTFYRSSYWGQRGFCPSCGSPLTLVYEGDPHPSICAGSLDKPNDWPISETETWGHVHVDDKVTWELICDDLARRRQGMDSSDAAKKAAKNKKTE